MTDMTYVGQTGHTLLVRRKEHLRALISGDSQASALAEHAIVNQHNTVVTQHCLE